MELGADGCVFGFLLCRMSGLWGPQSSLDLYLQEEGITTLLFAGVNTDQVRLSFVLLPRNSRSRSRYAFIVSVCWALSWTRTTAGTTASFSETPLRPSRRKARMRTWFSIRVL